MAARSVSREDFSRRSDELILYLESGANLILCDGESPYSFIRPFRKDRDFPGGFVMSFKDIDRKNENFRMRIEKGHSVILECSGNIRAVATSDFPS